MFFNSLLTFCIFLLTATSYPFSTKEGRSPDIIFIILSLNSSNVVALYIFTPSIKSYLKIGISLTSTFCLLARASNKTIPSVSSCVGSKNKLAPE